MYLKVTWDLKLFKCPVYGKREKQSLAFSKAVFLLLFFFCPAESNRSFIVRDVGCLQDVANYKKDLLILTRVEADLKDKAALI